MNEDILKNKDFTLIKTLKWVIILIILTVVIFVILDPLTRLQDSRDSSRSFDISNILTIIKLDYLDNNRVYLSSIKIIEDEGVYMIGTDTADCDAYTCDTGVSGSRACVDLSGLVLEGYVSSIPVSPNGVGKWTNGHTGYTLQKDSANVLTIRACESENTTEILVTQ